MESAVRRSFQTAWFDKWPWLHYREENDSMLCCTCLKAMVKKKLPWAANADAAFTDRAGVLQTEKTLLLDFLDMKHRFVTKRRS